jgi:hypothetical protein
MFDDIANAIGTALGADKTIGGLLAGATFTIILIIILEWTIGGNELDKGKTFMLSVGLGIVLSSVFGWFPLWVPLVMSLFIVLILVNPFGGD